MVVVLCCESLMFETCEHDLCFRHECFFWATRRIFFPYCSFSVTWYGPLVYLYTYIYPLVNQHSWLENGLFDLKMHFLLKMGIFHC